MTTTTKIIEAENITKIYKGKVKAVDNISFSVDQGEIFGFLGALTGRASPPPSRC